MTILDGRPNTALLIVDVQVDVVSGAWDRDGVIARINTLVDKARAAHVPVVWVQHSDDNMPIDSDGWHLVPGCRRRGRAARAQALRRLLRGHRPRVVLAERQVGRLVVTGAQTDACIRSTLHGALVRGYDVTLVGDAHTTEDLRQWGVPVSPEQVIAHTNTYWSGPTRPAARATCSQRPRSTSPRADRGRQGSGSAGQRRRQADGVARREGCAAPA